MKSKRWIVRAQESERATALARVLNISPILAALLIARGYGEEVAARAFLNPSHDQLHDPYLMLGMRDAVARLQLAIERREAILVYGDYDVDGTTGTAVLLRALKMLGAETRFHVPHRFTEGYGIQQPALEKAAAEGCKLAISVDCGIERMSHSTGRAIMDWMSLLLTIICLMKILECRGIRRSQSQPARM